MTSPEGQAAPWQTKTYEATIAGQRSTAIIVRQRVSSSASTFTAQATGPHTFGAGQVEYPLPFVDAHEHGRRFYGEQTVETSIGNRTFLWGYAGAGPRDTAASILADHFGGIPQPTRLVQRFKFDMLSGRDIDRGWTMTGAEIQAWVDEHRAAFMTAWLEAGVREQEAAELARLQALEDEELGRG